MKRIILIIAAVILLIIISGCGIMADRNFPEITCAEKAGFTSVIPSYSTDTGEADQAKSPEATDEANEAVVKQLSGLELSKAGIYELEANNIYLIDLDGDGNKDLLSLTNTSYKYEIITNNKSATKYHFGELYLTVNGTDYEDTGIIFKLSAKLIRKYNDSIGLIISGNVPAGNNVTYIYDFVGAQAILRQCFNYSVSELTMNSLHLCGCINFLGKKEVCLEGKLMDDFTITYEKIIFTEENCDMIGFPIKEIKLPRPAMHIYQMVSQLTLLIEEHWISEISKVLGKQAIGHSFP